MNSNEAIWNILIIFGIITIVVTLFIVAYEFYGAKNFCKQEEGSYSINLSFKDFQHLCSDEVIVQYNYGWDFLQQPFNNSNLYLNVGNPFSN